MSHVKRTEYISIVIYGFIDKFLLNVLKYGNWFYQKQLKGNKLKIGRNEAFIGIDEIGHTRVYKRAILNPTKHSRPITERGVTRENKAKQITIKRCINKCPQGGIKPNPTPKDLPQTSPTHKKLYYSSQVRYTHNKAEKKNCHRTLPFLRKGELKSSTFSVMS